MITTGFPALDKLTGGFRERQAYLLHGNAKEAKTALALAFLTQGANDGRPVALVTDRSADAVLEESGRLGFDLSERLSSGELLLFEYPSSVGNHSRQLADDSKIIREFQTLVGKHGIDRLVLDPVTPLLLAPSTAAAGHRFQSIASSFSDLGATTFYLLHTPGGAEYVPVCREAAQGVLRLDSSSSGTGRIVFERWSKNPAPHELEFGFVPGVGLVPVGRNLGTPLSAARPERQLGSFPHERHMERRAYSIPQLISARSGVSLDPYDKPRILLIHPDAAQRSAIGAMLAKHFSVEETHGAIDGLSSIGGGVPDIVVLAQEMRSVAGSAIAHKLRQSGHNMPIILVGSRVRRLSDQACFLQAGVDVCLEYPINAALLNLHIDNLLRRVGRLREPINENPDYLRTPQRAGQNCTTDLDVFVDRAVEELNYSRESGLPVPMCVMCCAPGKPMLEELSSAALMVTRATDLVYVGTRGIAILLPESRTLQPFLARFSKSWTAGAPPTVEQPGSGDQNDDLRAYLSEFLMENAGPGFSVAQGATDRKRVKPFGVPNVSSAV